MMLKTSVKALLRGGIAGLIALGLLACESEVDVYVVEPDPSNRGPRDPVAIADGEALYHSAELTCALSGCHGEDGTDRTLSAPLNPSNRFAFDELVTIIDTTMPFGNAGACVGDCANHIAQYIMEEFWQEGGSSSSSSSSSASSSSSSSSSSASSSSSGSTSSSSSASSSSSSSSSSSASSSSSSSGGNGGSPGDPAAISAGQTLYNDSNNICYVCHAADGTMTPPGGSAADVIAPSNKYTYTGLVDIITSTMPQTNPSVCTGTCADNIAQYMLDAFWDESLASKPSALLSAGAESELEPWLGVGESPSVIQSNAQAHSGLYSVMVFDRANALDGAGQYVSGLQIGRSYKVSVWVKLDNGSDKVALRVATGGDSTGETLATAVAGDGEWMQLEGLYHHLLRGDDRALLYLDGPQAGVMYYLDDLQVVPQD